MFAQYFASLYISFGQKTTNRQQNKKKRKRKEKQWKYEERRKKWSKMKIDGHCHFSFATVGFSNRRWRANIEPSDVFVDLHISGVIFQLKTNKQNKKQKNISIDLTYVIIRFSLPLSASLSKLLINPYHDNHRTNYLSFAAQREKWKFVKIYLKKTCENLHESN